MLSVDLDVSPLINRLNTMEQQLKKFPNQMGDELTEWQTEDMHRKYPNTTVTETYVETTIWPTSRVRLARPKGRKRRPAAILRPELYDKLVVRMSGLLSTLGWK
jgi:hypothetical protein